MNDSDQNDKLAFSVRLSGEHRKRFLEYKKSAGLISNAEVIRHLLKKIENLDKTMRESETD